MVEINGRDERQRTIRDILRREVVPNQDHLVRLLRERGYVVTQSSVSRDLKEIGVAKVEGRYALASELGGELEAPVERILLEGLRRVTRAGPHLLVLHTVVGGASRVALGIDQAGWPEVAGTIAGDDTIFLATVGLKEQEQVRGRLAPWESTEERVLD